MKQFNSFLVTLVIATILVTISGLSYGRHRNSIYEGSDEDIPSARESSISRDYKSGAVLMKNRVKGPADIGIYYTSSPSGSKLALMPTTDIVNTTHQLNYPTM
jgi:hypothetical protein